jgi:hypothetical protein
MVFYTGAIYHFYGVSCTHQRQSELTLGGMDAVGEVIIPIRQIPVLPFARYLSAYQPPRKVAVASASQPASAARDA